MNHRSTQVFFFLAFTLLFSSGSDVSGLLVLLAAAAVLAWDSGTRMFQENKSLVKGILLHIFYGNLKVYNPPKKSPQSQQKKGVSGELLRENDGDCKNPP